MSQLPQNNETLDNSPEYSEPYQENSNGHPGTVAPGGQLPPASEFSEDVLSQEAGRFAANLSLLFGALSFACIPGIRSSLYFIPFSLILGLLGIWQGRVARRHGVPALAGRILSWAGVGIVLALYIFVILFLVSLSHSL